MSTTPIGAVMFFVEDPEEACRWWATHLGHGAEVQVEGGFAWLDRDDVEVGFHPSDPAKNPVGGSPVVYWAVDDLDAARTRLITAGCTPHRGPLTISDERRICQLVDPFGNTFGLDGR